MVDEAQGLDGLVVVGMQRLSRAAVLHVAEAVLDLPMLLVCQVELFRIAFQVAAEGEDTPTYVANEIGLGQENFAYSFLSV